MERLTQRAEFLAAADGGRISTPAFTLQVRSRGDGGPARFGFTVSRKVGTAVERNRVRRRLKAAATLLAGPCARVGHDYVIVGRRIALGYRFGRLGSDLQDALRRAEDRRARERAKAARSDDRLAENQSAAPERAARRGKPPPTDESLR